MKKQISGGRYMPVLGAALALCLAGALVLALSGTGSGASSTAPGASTLFAAQSAVIQAERALSGDSTTFDALDESISDLQSVDTAGWPAAQVATVERLRAALSAVAGNRDILSALPTFAGDIDNLSAELTERVYALQGLLATQQQPVADAQLERLRLIAAGLSKDVRQLTLGGSESATLTQQMYDGQMTMDQIVRAFESGDPELGIQALTEVAERDALSAVSATSSAIGEKIRDVLSLTDSLGAVDQARRQIDSAQVALAGTRLETAGESDAAPNVMLAALLFTGLLLFAVMAWIYQRSADIRRVAAEQSEQNDRNQSAIMRLLDELGSLADGDLTTTATVTEDITGAIADSINYAIEQLRDLVATLNDSAITVDGAARRTDDTAQQLSTASEALSNQIDAASQAIALMAASIEEVSGNAERSSDVARHSVDVAHKGGDAVRRTIEGMNAIRETIQETSKRIKRLGESSQEIGNIVELINDIADQTNILALNASIQASMAGEAGRGFAVVADEVQRLAERSTNATKQIEVLVRTIQADTNEAVVSMERSTTDVVGGALLAENAGAALEEIEQVSNQIASLVQNISSSAREQANAAEAVTQNMDKLQEINSQTAEGTRSTTRSIREMAALAAQLRSAVSGFRLPEPDGEASGSAGVIASGMSAEEPGKSEEDGAESPDGAPFVDQKTA